MLNVNVKALRFLKKNHYNMWIITFTLVFLALNGVSDCQEQTECLCLQDMVAENELRTAVRLKPFPDGTGRLLVAESVR